jgi:hypothetical protein
VSVSLLKRVGWSAAAVIVVGCTATAVFHFRKPRWIDCWVCDETGQVREDPTDVESVKPGWKLDLVPRVAKTGPETPLPIMCYPSVFELSASLRHRTVVFRSGESVFDSGETRGVDGMTWRRFLSTWSSAR